LIRSVAWPVEGTQGLGAVARDANPVRSP
jgi:hypothetical protein